MGSSRDTAEARTCVDKKMPVLIMVKLRTGIFVYFPIGSALNSFTSAGAAMNWGAFVMKLVKCSA